MKTDIDMMKDMANKMKSALKEFEYNVKLGHCYEVLSVMYGYKNWDTFCAILKARITR